MKQIMTFELYKSTYMSAADKLEQGHKKRSEELKKHAVERGISAFTSKEGFDRIYPHPFVFENHSKLKDREDFLGEFFITGFEDHVYGTYRPDYHGVKVIMQSDYGKKILVEFVTGPKIIFLPASMPKNFFSLDLEYDFEGGSKATEIKSFRFENRKDAMEFRKFIFELAEDGELERGDTFFNLDTMPINKLYSTN
jgi:hypothetical protein